MDSEGASTPMGHSGPRSELIYLVGMDYEGANIPMGPNGPRSKFIYFVSMGYEGRIDSRFTFVHKGILIIM